MSLKLPAASTTVPGTVSYYEEWTGTNGACTGTITATPSYALKAVRIGNVVTLTIPPVFQTPAGGGTNFSYSQAVPSQLRPLNDQVMFVQVKVAGNTSSTPGVMYLNASTGIVTIFRDGVFTGTFTGGSGIDYPQSMTFTRT